MEQTKPAVETLKDPAPFSSGVTKRGVLIGVGLSATLAFLDICAQALGGGSLTSNGFGSGPLFLLFLLICGAGYLERLGLIRSSLKPQEFLVIFSMLLMVSAVSTSGVMMFLIPHIVGFSHYATPENEWGSMVLPLLPEGITVKDPAASKGFFEGLGPGEAVPYGSWIGPLLSWMVMLGAIYLTMISLMVILRKRWMEEERLPFPLAQLPMAMVEADPGEGPLLRNGLLWSGFAVPGLVGLSGIAHRFLPFMPTINLYFYTRFYRNSMGLLIYAHFFVLGISYLVSLDILSSVLLFTFFGYVQIFLVVLSGSPILGWGPYVPGGNYGQLKQESFGAIVAMVGFGLYEARHHLRDVFRKAMGTAPQVDDSDELISYRASLVGTVAGVAFICYWLSMTGVSTWIVPIFVVLMLVTFVGVTRILAETGVVMQAPLSPMQVFLNSLGTEKLSRGTSAGFFLGQPWAFPSRTHVMASTSTSLKLTHQSGLRSRSLFYVLILALVVGGGVAGVTLLHFAYKLGAYGFANSWYMIKALNYHLQYYGGAIKDPATATGFWGGGGSVGESVRFIWSGMGILAMGLLILARKRFFWWPFHPIGYLIGTTLPSWWVNILIAWLIKRNVLKYGGASLYGRTRPFFLGLVLGQAVISSVGTILTILTGKT